jgi:hypothetical protein
VDTGQRVTVPVERKPSNPIPINVSILYHTKYYTTTLQVMVMIMSNTVTSPCPIPLSWVSRSCSCSSCTSS